MVLLALLLHGLVWRCGERSCWVKSGLVLQCAARRYVVDWGPLRLGQAVFGSALRGKELRGGEQFGPVLLGSVFYLLRRYKAGSSLVFHRPVDRGVALRGFAWLYLVLSC